MKLKHIDIGNVCRLVPTWVANPVSVAKALEKTFAEKRQFRPRRWDDRLDYWVELSLDGAQVSQIRVARPQPGEEVLPLQIGAVVIDTDRFQICVPLNPMLKGADSLEGSHLVYAHSFPREGSQQTYIGLTKQRWFDRLAQHKSAAAAGSMLLFHRAIRQHADKKAAHIVCIAGLDYDYAMQMEEKLVDKWGLYPRGLNMIPGGFAGLKYLSSLGLAARSVEERDQAMDVLVRSEFLAGKANPLCAARWASDQEYVNSVICGHSMRLTISQVRNIRMLNAAGYSLPRIADVIQDSARRIKSVLDGKVYGRVA